jgi:hypothetical protein
MTVMDLEIILLGTLAIATLVAGTSMVLAMHRREADGSTRNRRV